MTLPHTPQIRTPIMHISNLQRCMPDLEAWQWEWKTKMKTDKSTVTILTKWSQRSGNRLNFLTKMPWLVGANYLCTHLEKTLTWKMHIKAVLHFVALSYHGSMHMAQPL
jgi:hypothetical protein